MLFQLLVKKLYMVPIDAAIERNPIHVNMCPKEIYECLLPDCTRLKVHTKFLNDITPT